MLHFTDQLNNIISLPNVPKKIISIVPSQSELLWFLGLDEAVIGITKFCIHPANWQQTKQKIGGTKKLNIEKIKALKPDLIIGNKEENDQLQILELQKHFPVWMSDIYNLNDALSMIESIGKITETDVKAFKLVEDIKFNFNEIKQEYLHNKSVVYLIWNNPIIAVGCNTFIDNMLDKCGLKNAISNTRYPEIDIFELQKINPEYLFLSSEPFPFATNHKQMFEAQLPNTKVVLVDGEMFSWYGNRLLLATEYFKHFLLHIEH